jgi:hypothetical protein
MQGEKKRYPVTDHFMISGVLGNKSKLDRWTGVWVEPLKAQIPLNEDTSVII